MRRMIFLRFVPLIFFCGFLSQGYADRVLVSTTTDTTDVPGNARRAEVLFLGNASEHHDSGKYAPWMATHLFKSGINLTYTENPNDLNTENLGKYDGLIIYANYDSITSSQEAALQQFVEGGKGLIPLHSAIGCFNNSDWYIKTIGGQFKSHGTGTFTAKIVNPSHPVMQGLSEFDTWDETYVHQRLNPDMTVLMERAEGDHREPYTWVRNQGKGRVFYTAYGHNDSTWTNIGFLNLVRNGVLWAIGDEVTEQIAALDIPDVDIYDSAFADFTQRHEVPKMQEALSAKESQKLMQVPVDFEIQLFAAEPDIINPIAMAWDEKGRLWIVESVDYPNTFRETDGAANDRIKICEDTDGDGKADKFTVFADSLNIPTSIVFANDGIIVAQAPFFTYMKDTDGDDKADIRKNIITGWGKNDTHSGPSNLQYGFDNKLWGVLGFSGFDGTVGGQPMQFPQGIYRFSADGAALEFLAPSSNNTWGLGFSEDNQVFISTANNTHSAFYSMPARYMQRSLPAPVAQANTEELQDEMVAVQPIQKIDGHYEVHTMTPNLRQVDVVGGFTAAAGHHLYTARSFPKAYWNRIAFVSEPTVRLVHQAVIEPDGAGFAEQDDWNLMASSDEWFGPVQAQVGPDGAVWVADWYNFIIQHNVFVPQQAPSRMVLPFTEQPKGQGSALVSEMRDTNHGRIYKVVYKDAKPYEPITLSKDDLPGLLAALKHDNMFWRMTAQRLLVESKNKAAIPSLYKLINNQEVDEIGLNSPAVHALWTLNGLGALDGSNAEAMQAVVKALSHPAAGVRKAAVEVLPKNQATIDALQKSKLISDPNLNVRMSALLVMAELPASDKLGEMVYQASLAPENTGDPWISKALLAAAIAHQKGFVAAANNKIQTAPEPNSLSARIMEAVSKEEYELPERGSSAYPIDVSGKEVIMKASIAKRDEALQGVIMAQGDAQNGYVLYIQEGKLHMVVKQDGKTYQATSNEPLPDDFDVVGRLSHHGMMSLEIDGEQVAKAKAASLFEKPLGSVVRTSRDLDDKKVGNYEDEFRLNARMENVSLELKAPMTMPIAAKKAVKQPVSAKKSQSTSKDSKAITIDIKVVPDMLQYNKEQITVTAGQKVIIRLDNPDGMQHNMLIIQPGTLQQVGAAADALARDPQGAQQNYVPKIPQVLFSTKLLMPQESTTLEFIAPDKPGDYPFVCTFPGHWRGMNGIMKVVEGNDLSGK